MKSFVQSNHISSAFYESLFVFGIIVCVIFFFHCFLICSSNFCTHRSTTLMAIRSCNNIVKNQFCEKNSNGFIFKYLYLFFFFIVKMVTFYKARRLSFTYLCTCISMRINLYTYAYKWVCREIIIVYK